MRRIFDITDSQLSTIEVAKNLLGRKLISETAEGITTGWIVETEAYLGVRDMAAHTYQWRKTPRVEAMYDQAGTIYIYNMMGNLLLNITTKEIGEPEAVLIRAVQPEQGLELMEARRGKTGYELTNGPGKMTQAMGISMEEYGSSIIEPPRIIYLSSVLS
jgi:DNA-3-methyladenine glycosylase